MLLKVNKPETIYIKFTGKVYPKLFTLFDSKQQMYFFRYLDGKTPRIKFNIPDPDLYSSPYEFEIIKQNSIETPANLPTLPPAERDRYKNVKVQFNPTLQGTPARIFTHNGLIEVGYKFYELPAPIRLFLLLHETGHLFYSTEAYCDQFALVNFLRMGYNRSTAMYALTNVLQRSPANMERIKIMLNNIQKTQNEPLL